MLVLVALKPFNQIKSASSQTILLPSTVEREVNRAPMSVTCWIKITTKSWRFQWNNSIVIIDLKHGEKLLEDKQKRHEILFCSFSSIRPGKSNCFTFLNGDIRWQTYREVSSFCFLLALKENSRLEASVIHSTSLWEESTVDLCSTSSSDDSTALKSEIDRLVILCSDISRIPARLRLFYLSNLTFSSWQIKASRRLLLSMCGHVDGSDLLLKSMVKKNQPLRIHYTREQLIKIRQKIPMHLCVEIEKK